MLRLNRNLLRNIISILQLVRFNFCNMRFFIIFLWDMLAFWNNLDIFSFKVFKITCRASIRKVIIYYTRFVTINRFWFNFYYLRIVLYLQFISDIWIYNNICFIFLKFWIFLPIFHFFNLISIPLFYCFNQRSLAFWKISLTWHFIELRWWDIWVNVWIGY